MSRAYSVFLRAWREAFEFAGVGSHVARLAVAPLLFPATVGFAGRLVEFDRRIRRDGPVAASRWIVRCYYRRVCVRGPLPPRNGPLLVVGNHPGLGDLPALLATIGRDDVAIVVAHRPLLQLLPALREYCIIVDGSLRSRAAAVREIVGRLLDGAAVAVYPAGRIEPDPAIESASDRLLSETWSPIVDAVARRLHRLGRRALVAPVLTSGIHHVPRIVQRMVDVSASGRAALATMVLRPLRRGAITVRLSCPFRIGCDVSPNEGTFTAAVMAALRQL